VALTGDRGLCGGYNTYAIKKAEMRAKELQGQGIDFDMICIGNKGNTVRPPPPTLLSKSFDTLPGRSCCCCL
jgi:F0F1-type ATP synthase gamma subunit